VCWLNILTHFLPGYSKAVTADEFPLLAVGGEKYKTKEKCRNEFHNRSFWLTDKVSTEVTVIVKRDKINDVKTGQNFASVDLR
jgi:hypothetical protein